MRKISVVLLLSVGVATFAYGCGSSGTGGTGGSSSSGPTFLPGFDPDAGSSGGSGTHLQSSSFLPGSSGTSIGPSSSGLPGGSSSGVMVSGAGSSTSRAASSSSPACVTNTGPITGTVGNSGGSISRLVFAVAGDTRPTNEDDVSGYPTTIIETIFNDIEALTPRPALVIGTGDYQFSEAGSSGTGAQQVQLYMNARKKFSGAFFGAMGNHECGVSGSFSTSDNNNCGPGNPGGVTTNYNAFMNEMMSPIGQTKPYYAINVNASDGSWTAKFVITAANSWDTAQETWLTTTMAQPTTYTFVVRHEASDSYPPLPVGVAGVDAILAHSTYTMIIVGHDHSHGHFNDATGTHQEAIFGNGGAPITNGSDFGYGLFSQRCDGAIVVDAIDYMTGNVDSYFHFVVTPNGALTH